MSDKITKEQVDAAIGIVAAVGEAIMHLGQVPNGHLYAHVMHRLTMRDYDAIIETLKRAKLIVERNNLLIWIGTKEQGR